MHKSFFVSLPVQIIRQGKKYIAFTPALDLSTSGLSETQAQKRFDELVHIFFEEIIEAGTLDEVLKELGWEKQDKSWQPPQIVAQRKFDLKIPARV